MLTPKGHTTSLFTLPPGCDVIIESKASICLEWRPICNLPSFQGRAHWSHTILVETLDAFVKAALSVGSMEGMTLPTGVD
jgi:hypothetical protein